MEAWLGTAGQIAGDPDLWWAAGLILAVVVASFTCGVALAERRPERAEQTLALVLALLACYLLFDRGHFWAIALPRPWLLLAIHWPTFALALGAGLAIGQGMWWRSVARSVAGGLLGLAVATPVLPLIRPLADPCPLADEDRWRDDLCLQTCPVSCSPAAAATFLRIHGIAATEASMARQCLTHGRGTSTLGLYYGLNKTAAQRGRRVIAGHSNLSRLLQQRQWPAVINVRFTDADVPADRSTWTGAIFSGGHSARHTIVLLGPHPEGGWQIADPAFGMDRWTNEQLSRRWTGESFWIAQR